MERPRRLSKTSADAPETERGTQLGGTHEHTFMCLSSSEMRLTRSMARNHVQSPVFFLKGVYEGRSLYVYDRPPHVYDRPPSKSPNNVFVMHVVKPVLVRKRRRCSASQVADFRKSFIEDLLRRTDYDIMGLLMEQQTEALPNMRSSVDLKIT